MRCRCERFCIDALTEKVESFQPTENYSLLIVVFAALQMLQNYDVALLY